jgi:transposase
VTTEQLKEMIGHITTKPQFVPALQYHFVDGLSVYEAEKRAGLSKNSLQKKVDRFNKELAYIKRFNKAAHVHEEQYELGV